jgi:hypothetical protein
MLLFYLLLIPSLPGQAPEAGPSDDPRPAPCSALHSPAENGSPSSRLRAVEAAAAPGPIGQQAAFEEVDETIRGLIGPGGSRDFGRHEALVDDRLPGRSSRRDRERFADRSTSLRC